MIRQKTLIETLHGRKTERTPIWLMRQAGRYLPEYRVLRGQAKSFLDFCFTPDLAVEATLQPIRRYDLDAAILFSDILVIPFGLGQKVWFEEGIGPLLDPIADTDALKGFETRRMTEVLQPVYETLRRLRQELSDDRTLIGFAGAPWTLSSHPRSCRRRSSRALRQIRSGRRRAAIAPWSNAALRRPVPDAHASRHRRTAPVA